MLNFMPTSYKMFEGKLQDIERRKAQSKEWLRSGVIIGEQNDARNNNINRDHDVLNAKNTKSTGSSCLSSKKHPQKSALANKCDHGKYLYSVQILGPENHQNDSSEVIRYKPNILVGKRCYVCNDPYCPNISWVAENPHTKPYTPITIDDDQYTFTQSYNGSDFNGNSPWSVSSMANQSCDKFTNRNKYTDPRHRGYSSDKYTCDTCYRCSNRANINDRYSSERNINVCNNSELARTYSNGKYPNDSCLDNTEGRFTKSENFGIRDSGSSFNTRLSNPRQFSNDRYPDNQSNLNFPRFMSENFSIFDANKQKVSLIGSKRNVTFCDDLEQSYDSKSNFTQSLGVDDTILPKSYVPKQNLNQQSPFLKSYIPQQNLNQQSPFKRYQDKTIIEPIPNQGHRDYNYYYTNNLDFETSVDKSSLTSAYSNTTITNDMNDYGASPLTASTNTNCDCDSYHSHVFTNSGITMSMTTSVRRAPSVAPSLCSSQNVAYKQYEINNFMNICNTFWRPRLSFNPYTHGDKTLTFPSIWPPETQLKQLVMEAFEGTELRRNILDMCKLALHCGPVRLLKCLLELKIIGIDQVFEDGSGMLHLACIARNLEAVIFLCSAGISPKIRDKFGHTADQVCFCPKLRKVLPPRYIQGGALSSLQWSNKGPIQASQHELVSIFHLTTSTRYYEELMKKLQIFDFDVNRHCDENGDFLLHRVVGEGISQLAVALAIVNLHGGDINLCNGDGMTPLMIAANNGDAIFCDVLMCLCGANPNQPNSMTKQTALHFACLGNSSETVVCLIKRGACFNLEDCGGCRPDDLLYDQGSEVCQEIVESERQQRAAALATRVKQGEISPQDIRVTDLFVVDNKYRTLIMVAAAYNRVDNLVTLLKIEGAPIDAQHARSGATALVIATISQSRDAVATLLERLKQRPNLPGEGCSNTDTILWRTSPAINIALAHGANPAIATMNGYLPLHYAIMEENDEMVQLMLQYFPGTYTRLELALKLCKSSSMQYQISRAFHRRQEELVTPELFDCALTGDSERLVDVLEEGDTINTKRGVNPLYLAVENGHLDVVKLLYEKGGDIRCRHPTTQGTVLHAASRLGHTDMMDFLLQFARPIANVAHISRRLKQQNGAAAQSHYKELNVNDMNADGKTCLQLAAEKGAGYLKIVRMLLDHGATTAILDENGYLFTSPDYEGVRVAIQSYRDAHTEEVMKCITEKRGLAKLRALWQSPFDHNLRDKDGDTPLMVAAKSPFDHNLRDKDGDTPLMVAAKVGRTDTVKFLLSSAVYKNKRINPSDADSPKPVDSGPNSAPLSDEVFYNSSHHTPDSASRRTATSLSTFAPSQLAVTRKDSETTDERLVSYSTPPVYLPSDSEETGKQLAFRKFMVDIHLPRGLYIYQVGRVCHVNAVNLTDGNTPLHRAIQGADNPAVLLLLLRCDSTSVNSQNDNGLSPLHLAAKLGRKRVLEKLLARKDIDLHLQTKQQQDLEELTTNKTIRKMIAKAKHLNPATWAITSPTTIPTTTTASTVNPVSPTTSVTTNTIIDLDKIGERFKSLKKKYHDSRPFACMEDAKNNGASTKNNGASTKNNGASMKNNGATTKNNGATTKNNGATTKNNGATTKNNGATTKNNGASTKNNATSTKNNISTKNVEISTKNVRKSSKTIKSTKLAGDPTTKYDGLDLNLNIGPKNGETNNGDANAIKADFANTFSTVR